MTPVELRVRRAWYAARARGEEAEWVDLVGGAARRMRWQGIKAKPRLAYLWARELLGLED